jgi:hypothetical protein
MKLNVRALAITAGVIWAAGVFLVALQAVASIYPGYRTTSGFGGVIVGALYALVDAAVAGAIFAWIYNWLATPGESGAA